MIRTQRTLFKLTSSWSEWVPVFDVELRVEEGLACRRCETVLPLRERHVHGEGMADRVPRYRRG